MGVAVDGEGAGGVAGSILALNGARLAALPSLALAAGVGGEGQELAADRCFLARGEGVADPRVAEAGEAVPSLLLRLPTLLKAVRGGEPEGTTVGGVLPVVSGVSLSPLLPPLPPATLPATPLTLPICSLLRALMFPLAVLLRFSISRLWTLSSALAGGEVESVASELAATVGLIAFGTVEESSKSVFSNTGVPSSALDLEGCDWRDGFGLGGSGGGAEAGTSLASGLCGLTLGPADGLAVGPAERVLGGTAGGPGLPPGAGPSLADETEGLGEVLLRMGSGTEMEEALAAGGAGLGLGAVEAAGGAEDCLSVAAAEGGFRWDLLRPWESLPPPAASLSSSSRRLPRRSRLRDLKRSRLDLLTVVAKWLPPLLLPSAFPAAEGGDPLP